MNALTNWTKQMEQSPLAKAERDYLSKIFPGLRGYHLLLLGAHKPLTWLPSHCLHAFTLAQEKISHESHIQSSYDILPIRPSSIDAVIIPYLLEYIDSPEILLEEIYQLLIAEGKLTIFGFNRLHPWCWLNAPKPKQNLPLWKLKQNLSALTFSITKIHWLYYGAIYIIEAQKQVLAVTPLRPQWSTPAIEKSWQPTARKAS